MKDYYDILQEVKLFKGIKGDDLKRILACLVPRYIDVKKGEFVLRAGDKPHHMGVVLEGQFHIVKEDLEGERQLLTVLEQGNYYAESLCCAQVLESPVSVIAETDGKVMLLTFDRILHRCSNACSFHTELVKNMMQILAIKNMEMQKRMEYLSKKSIRGRLMTYFEMQAKSQGPAFSIPFNREGLADFLSMDRSALSRELGRMKEEGIIDFWKNHFKLLKKAE